MKELKTLSECVLFYRHLLNESQEIFAERSGLSPEMISLIERQETNPTLASIIKISEHIGISVSEMFAFNLNKAKKLLL